MPIALRIYRKSRNSLLRFVYRQQVQWGWGPPRPEMPQGRFDSLRTVCAFLGPYRNLTTLTASILGLHPHCQVLNHGGFRVIADPRLNFLGTPDPLTLRRFCHFADVESQGGRGGDQGGAITLSHAFEHSQVRDTYQARYGDQLAKEPLHCLAWKESLAVAQFLQNRTVDVEALFAATPRLRLLMPIRNPLDCALSNCKTGHYKRLGIRGGPDPQAALTAIIDQIAWFRRWAEKHPDRFFSFFQFEIGDSLLQRLAEFLELDADQRWRRDVLACTKLKRSYAHDADLVAHYDRLICERFEKRGDAAFAAQLRKVAEAP